MIGINKNKNLAFIILIVLTGCGVTQAVAPRENLTPQHLQYFPKQDIEFYSNQFFLWPENVTPDQISKVLSLSHKINQLEDLIIPVKKEKENLHLEDKNNELLQIKNNQELSKILAILNKKKSDLKRQNQKLEKVLLKKANINLTQEQSQELEYDIEKIKNHIQYLREEIDRVEIQKVQFENQVYSSDQDTRRERNQFLDKQLKENIDLKLNLLKKLEEIVCWFEAPPTFIGFHFEEDGSIRVSIRGWKLDKNELKVWDFGTLPGPGGKSTIENVSYTESGGIFEFDVRVYEDESQTRLRETYSFRIARSRYYENTNKVFYTGKMKRIRINQEGSVELREGFAHLSNES